MANPDCCNTPGRCSDDEDFSRDQEPLRSRVGDDAEDEDCCAESGTFLALFASNKGGHLGVARYDEEDCSFEVLQLPHDQDCQGLSMILQQVSLKPWQLPLAPQNLSMTAASCPALCSAAALCSRPIDKSVYRAVPPAGRGDFFQDP